MVQDHQTFRDWMLDQALLETSMEQLLCGCYERLCQEGVPLDRGHIAFHTIHPLFEATAYTWNSEDRFQEREVFPLGRSNPGFEFRLSPQYQLIQSKEFWLRRRKDGVPADFPVIQSLWDQGYTDFCAYLLLFDEESRDGVIGSFATKHPEGFSDAQERLLQEAARLIGIASKGIIRHDIAENVLSTYLGQEAGRRVLTGQIGRGHHEEMTGVIWLADLRESTRLAVELEAEAYLQLLDDYFEAVADPIVEGQGEVLLLIGDAVLAIFPSDGVGPGEACQNALAAWRSAETRVAQLNEKRQQLGQEPIAFGLGLHLGSFLFGNIGTRERLEFTAVGRAVNLASRLQSQCRPMGVRLLASPEFAAEVPAESWKCLGRKRFDGFGEEVEILTLED